MLGHDRLSRRPQCLGDDQPAEDTPPRVVGTLANPYIGAVGLEIEDATDIDVDTLTRLGWVILLFRHACEATLLGVITVDDFEVFCRRSFAGVLAVADRLGDDLINKRPPITNGNTPFALITHMLGACEWWVGHMVVGDPSTRVRAEEFTASGTVADLHVSVYEWLSALARRRSAIEVATELAEVPQTQTPLEGEWTVGAALIHAYEELVQHLGHLEITADLLLADTGS